MAENCFQKAPDQDLAQTGHFPMVPEGDFNCWPKALKLPKFASKGLPARIWPKTAVSQWPQKGILIAGPKALKMPKIASKRLPARIWPQNGRFPMVPEWNFNCRPRALKLPKFASKRLLARIWPFGAPPGGAGNTSKCSWV